MDCAEIDLLNHVAVPVFVLAVDASGQPVFCACNNEACRFSGLFANDVMGLTAEQVYPGETGQSIHAQLCQVVRLGESVSFELDYPVDGRIRFIRMSLLPRLSSEGKVLRIVGTAVDVTADHDLREERNRSSTMTQELETFISMSAHDLLTPIRNVKALTAMLLDDFKDHGDGKLEIIQALERVSGVVISLIGDVLIHAEATGATESVETFELAGLCHDIRAMLDPENRHSVVVDETFVHGDRTATQIILRNLIDNAFKHNSDRVVALRISAVKIFDGFFQIVVEDDGVGIDERTLQFLNGAELRAGNGFGLLGIRKLIRLRGGVLHAALPESGRGAMITFTLPGDLTDRC